MPQIQNVKFHYSFNNFGQLSLGVYMNFVCSIRDVTWHFYPIWFLVNEKKIIWQKFKIWNYTIHWTTVVELRSLGVTWFGESEYCLGLIISLYETHAWCSVLVWSHGSGAVTWVRTHNMHTEEKTISYHWAKILDHQYFSYICQRRNCIWLFLIGKRTAL